MKTKNFIIFSSVDWEVNWQLHHELVTSILNSGSKVLFIENTGSRNIKFSDFSRVFSRIKNWISSKKGYKILNSNFLLFSPLVIPFPYNKISILINSYIMNKSIQNWMKNTSSNEVSFISFLPTPLVLNVFLKINSVYKIYYCADNMIRDELVTSKRLWEKKFIQNVDSVFCTSHNLFKKCKLYNSETYLIPSGVNFEKFTKVFELKKDYYKPLKNYKSPIIGYIGAITGVFDQNLLAYLADKLPNYTFIIVGRVYVSINKLKKYNNIHFIGHVKHDDIPYFLKSFNISIIPYLKNEFTESVYSFKLNEYLSMGLPVVTSNLYEFQIFEKKYPNAVYVADTYEQFVNYLKKDLSFYSKHKYERNKVAKENSWSNRFKSMLEIFNNLHLRKISSFKKIEEKKQITYLNSKSIFSFLVLPILIIYLLSFHSPLFYKLSKILEVNYEVSNADAIVVFSGDGYSGYENLGFQNRTLDVLKYYKLGLADKILISSGKEQTINQVEIIRALLIQNGINKNDIKIFTEYPSSTYANILMINKELEKRGIEEIIFITAPLHSKRASLIWSKNFPELKIHYAKPVDSTIKNKRNLNYSEIKVVIYEYLSICYNFIKGRL